MKRELSKIIRVNEQKEVPLDSLKDSLDGCFESMIVNRLGLNRAGLCEIRNRPKPVYALVKKMKEEIYECRDLFKEKKSRQIGTFTRKTLATNEDIEALFFRK